MCRVIQPGKNGIRVCKICIKIASRIQYTCRHECVLFITVFTCTHLYVSSCAYTSICKSSLVREVIFTHRKLNIYLPFMKKQTIIIIYIEETHLNPRYSFLVYDESVKIP